MTSKDLHGLNRCLQELAAALAGVTSFDTKRAPEAHEELTRLLELLADRDLLAENGFYTLEEERLRRATRALDNAGIPYAVVGGNAALSARRA